MSDESTGAENTATTEEKAENNGANGTDAKSELKETQEDNLVAQKIALRRRAQEAEKKYADLSKQHEEVLKEIDSLRSKVGEYEFRDTKAAKFKEALEKIPEGKTISRMDLVEKYVADLNDPNTLEAKIGELVNDFMVDAPKGGRVEVVPFGKTPAANGADIEIDWSNPHAMYKLRQQNPDAFDSAVQAARNGKGAKSPLDAFQMKPLTLDSKV